jgi:hypothetical protein
MSQDAFGLSQAQDVHFYDAESGHWISENSVRLAEIIADYDHRMKLVWIPPKDRDGTDTHPFAIEMREDNGRVHMLMKLTDTEIRNPQAVLARIFRGDTRRHDVLKDLEAEDAARKAWQMKQRLEELEEANDFALSVLKSPLHSYKHNGKQWG